MTYRYCVECDKTYYEPFDNRLCPQCGMALFVVQSSLQKVFRQALLNQRDVSRKLGEKNAQLRTLLHEVIPALLAACELGDDRTGMPYPLKSLDGPTFLRYVAEFLERDPHAQFSNDYGRYAQLLREKADTEAAAIKKAYGKDIE